MLEDITIKKPLKYQKAFKRFLHILPLLRRCRFCLIILEKKSRCNSQGTIIEKKTTKNYLEQNQAFKQNKEECKYLHAKV